MHIYLARGQAAFLEMKCLKFKAFYSSACKICSLNEILCLFNGETCNQFCSVVKIGLKIRTGVGAGIRLPLKGIMCLLSL